ARVHHVVPGVRHRDRKVHDEVPVEDFTIPDADRDRLIDGADSRLDRSGTTRELRHPERTPGTVAPPSPIARTDDAGRWRGREGVRDPHLVGMRMQHDAVT